MSKSYVVDSHFLVSHLFSTFLLSTSYDLGTEETKITKTFPLEA